MTELDEDADDADEQLRHIMDAASKDLPESCECDGFVFITCKSKGRKKIDPKCDDATTIACCGLLSECGLKLIKKGPSCAGSYSVSFDSHRCCGLIRVHPKRKCDVARDGARDGCVRFVAEDCNGVHVQDISMSGKTLEEGAKRAAAKVHPLPCSSIFEVISCIQQFLRDQHLVFWSQKQITVRLHDHFVGHLGDFRCTFDVADLNVKSFQSSKFSKGPRRSSGGAGRQRSSADKEERNSGQAAWEDSGDDQRSQYNSSD